jgi:hypothetical protein
MLDAQAHEQRHELVSGGHTMLPGLTVSRVNGFCRMAAMMGLWAAIAPVSLDRSLSVSIRAR